MFKKILSLSIIICFFLTTLSPLPQAHADTILDLPAPGTMVSVSPSFEPALIRGLTVHQDNPFLFDFIVDPGQAKLPPQALKDESDRMIKYFFAALTIPDKDIWVNLSPYEKDRMIPVSLGQTAMGRDLLAQDYMLKQLTASLIYPQRALGKTFWAKVYAKAKEMYGTTEIPVNTFNKVWIVPQRVGIYEHGQTAFIVDGHLKVMLEEDYLSLRKHPAISSVKRPNSLEGGSLIQGAAAKQSHTFASQIIKSIVLPEIEKEINEGKNFATLRQIFYAQALAVWFKRNLKQALLNQVYANKGTVKGIDQNDAATNEAIYRQYLKAYKKGVFNFIQEDIDPVTQETLPRKYFSGGYAGLGNLAMVSELPSAAMVTATGNDERVTVMVTRGQKAALEVANQAKAIQAGKGNAAMTADLATSRSQTLGTFENVMQALPYYYEDIRRSKRNNGREGAQLLLTQYTRRIGDKEFKPGVIYVLYQGTVIIEGPQNAIDLQKKLERYVADNKIPVKDQEGRDLRFGVWRHGWDIYIIGPELERQMIDTKKKGVNWGPIVLPIIGSKKADSLLANNPAMTTVEQGVKRIIAEYSGKDPSKILPTSSLEHDLGLDSLDIMDILLEIEDAIAFETDIEIPENVEELRSFQDVINYVRTQGVTDVMWTDKAMTTKKDFLNHVAALWYGAITTSDKPEIKLPGGHILLSGLIPEWQVKSLVSDNLHFDELGEKVPFSVSRYKGTVTISRLNVGQAQGAEQASAAMTTSITLVDRSGKKTTLTREEISTPLTELIRALETQEHPKSIELGNEYFYTLDLPSIIPIQKTILDSVFAKDNIGSSLSLESSPGVTHIAYKTEKLTFISEVDNEALGEQYVDFERKREQILEKLNELQQEVSGKNAAMTADLATSRSQTLGTFENVMQALPNYYEDIRRSKRNNGREGAQFLLTQYTQRIGDKKVKPGVIYVLYQGTVIIEGPQNAIDLQEKFERYVADNKIPIKDQGRDLRFGVWRHGWDIYIIGPELERQMSDTKGVNWGTTVLPRLKDHDDRDKAMRGGIDLSQQDAALHVTKDANGGVKVNVDPALIARIEREGMPEVDPVIIDVQPANARAIFGFEVSVRAP